MWKGTNQQIIFLGHQLRNLCGVFNNFSCLTLLDTVLYPRESYSKIFFSIFFNLLPVNTEVSVRKASPAYALHIHQEICSATTEQDLSELQNGARKNNSLIFRPKRGKEEEKGRSQQWQNCIASLTPVGDVFKSIEMRIQIGVQQSGNK